MSDIRWRARIQAEAQALAVCIVYRALEVEARWAAPSGTSRRPARLGQDDSAVHHDEGTPDGYL